MNRELRLLALAVAAAGTLAAAFFLLSIVFGGGVASVPPIASNANDSTARRAAIEATIAATPEIAPFFERLKVLLPARYDAAIAKAVATAPGSVSDSPDIWLSDAVKILRQSHGALAAKADAGPLQQIFVRQESVLAALSDKDSRLCVDFLYGGASEDFFRFAAANRALVGRLALANLDAIGDGQQKKIARDQPTDADFAALETALRDRGLSPTEIATLLDGKAPDPPPPDARLCEMGRLYLEAIASLPEDIRVRLYALAADLMARS